jgi:hypothetical protein
MSTPTRTFARAAVKATMVGVTTYISVFVFRLGWFIPLVVIAGAVVAWVVTGSERRASLNGTVVGVVALLSYLLTAMALFWSLMGQVSYRTLAVTWHDQGKANHTSQSEIFLNFTDFPGHGVSRYSNALRDHLAAGGSRETTVEFEVTSDNWCFRGFHEVRIGGTDLSTLPGIGGDYSVSGDGKGPWESGHWWCR